MFEDTPLDLDATILDSHTIAKLGREGRQLAHAKARRRPSRQARNATERRCARSITRRSVRSLKRAAIDETNNED